MNLKLTIPFQTILQRWPEATKACIDQANKRGIQTDPAKWQWALNWCVRIEGNGSFADMIQHAQEQVENPEPDPIPTVQQELADYARRVEASLECHPQSRRFYYAKIQGCPQEIIDHMRPVYEKDIANRQRIDSLTPEQRDAETQQLLKELRKDKGFMEIHL